MAYRWKGNIKKLKKKLSPSFIVFFCIVLFSIYFGLLSLLRYDNFYTGRFDLGNMDQTVWNTFRGRVFMLTDPNGTEIISRLSIHADFFLILLAPLYRIWNDPRMLLVVQSVTVAIGALFLYHIAKKLLTGKWLPVIVSLLFLFNPSVEHATLYDFHTVTLATTFLLAAFYFFLRRSYVWFFLFCVLAGLTKEQVWIIIAFFGAFFLLRSIKTVLHTNEWKKQQIIESLFGIALIFFGLFLFYYLVWYAIPHTRGSEHFALSFYSDFGTSPTIIVKNILTNPLKILQTLITTDRSGYLIQLFLPLGFLPVLSPHLLIFIVPELLINLLSNNVQFRQIYFQYTATITPFLFIASIYSLRTLFKIFPRLPQPALIIYLAAFTLYAAYMFGPLPGTKHPNLDMVVKPLPYKNTVDAYLSHISKRKSIAATNNLGSHLSHRQRIYTIPVGIEKADVVAFLLNDPFAQPSLQQQKQMVANLKNNSSYKLVFKEQDFFVFERQKVK